MQPRPEPSVLHRPISSGSVLTEASSHPQLSLKSFPKASLPRALPKACQSKITHPTATTNRKRTSYFGKEFLPEAGITVVPSTGLSLSLSLPTLARAHSPLSCPQVNPPLQERNQTRNKRAKYTTSNLSFPFAQVQKPPYHYSLLHGEQSCNSNSI